MKIGYNDAKAIAPLLRAAVESQIECWKFQRQIEHELGIDFKSMEQSVADWAAASNPNTITNQDAQAFIEALETEGPHEESFCWVNHITKARISATVRRSSGHVIHLVHPQ